MSKLKCWAKETDTNFVRYRNKKNSSLTYEIHEFDDEMKDELETYKYYHFPAINGRGIPSSPDFAETKKEAISEAQKYMKDHDRC